MCKAVLLKVKRHSIESAALCTGNGQCITGNDGKLLASEILGRECHPVELVLLPVDERTAQEKPVVHVLEHEAHSIAELVFQGKVAHQHENASLFQHQLVRWKFCKLLFMIC